MSESRNPEELSAEKRQFAAALIRLGNPYKASQEVFRDNFIKACSAAEAWPADPEVQAFLEELRQTVPDECALLPSKAEVARQLWDIGTDDDNDGKTKVAALKVYSEIQGYLKKEVSPVKIESTGVMVVRDHGSAEDWEKSLAAQQAALAGQ